MTQIFRRLFLSSLFAALLFAAGLQTNSAQNNAKPADAAPKRQWYRIQESIMKFGVANEYYDFRVKERVPALKKAGFKHEEIWVGAAVGTAGALYTIEPLDDLSGYDQAQNRLTKALGEEGARALGKKTSQYFIDGMTHGWLAMSDPELSWTEQMTSAPKIAIVGRMKIARGRGTDFRNYIKNDYLPVVKKSGARGYQVLSVRYGGDLGEYITLTFFDSFAELEKNDPSNTSVLNRVLGEATAQKTVQKTVGVILNLERNIIRFRPDLSILPK